ncbi:hypothetical protein HanIR_Chr07g0336111 [Helianthus annuus]|nr:hypothetical protein HanIR_Chr07g0336111 [Helianthus annuus]
MERDEREIGERKGRPTTSPVAAQRPTGGESSSGDPDFGNRRLGCGNSASDLDAQGFRWNSGDKAALTRWYGVVSTTDDKDLVLARVADNGGDRRSTTTYNCRNLTAVIVVAIVRVFGSIRFLRGFVPVRVKRVRSKVIDQHISVYVRVRHSQREQLSFNFSQQK